MSTNGTTVTVAGQLTADPELRFTGTGVPVASLTIVCNDRVYDRDKGGYVDGEATFLNVTAWRKLGEHATESFLKGQRVMATGKLRQRQWENRDGSKGSRIELVADELAASVLFGVTKFHKPAGGATGTTGTGQRSQDADQWGDEDVEPPF